jgi:hypothetical protein
MSNRWFIKLQIGLLSLVVLLVCSGSYAQATITVDESAKKTFVALNQSDINTCCVDRDRCNARFRALAAFDEELQKMCGVVPADPNNPPPHPTFPPKPPKPPKPPISGGGGATHVGGPLLICQLPAKANDDNTYCICPEGVSARVVDADAHYNGKVVKGVCVPTLEQFRARMLVEDNRFKGMCKPVLLHTQEIQSLCDESGNELNEMYLWYLSLIKAKTPLTAQSWQDLGDVVTEHSKRLDQIESELKRIWAILEKLCPKTAENSGATLEERIEQCRRDFQKNGKSNPVELQVLVGGNMTNRHEGSTTVGSQLIVNAIWWLGQEGRDGVGVGGMVGGADDGGKGYVTAGGRVFYTRALNRDKTVAIRGGVMMQHEHGKRVSEGQSTSIAPELGVQVRIAKGVVLDLGVGVGGERHMVREANGSQHLSNIGLAVMPSLSLGFSTQWE